MPAALKQSCCLYFFPFLSYFCRCVNHWVEREHCSCFTLRNIHSFNISQNTFAIVSYCTVCTALNHSLPAVFWQKQGLRALNEATFVDKQPTALNLTASFEVSKIALHSYLCRLWEEAATSQKGLRLGSRTEVMLDTVDLTINPKG